MAINRRIRLLNKKKSAAGFMWFSESRLFPPQRVVRNARERGTGTSLVSDSVLDVPIYF